MLRAPPSPHPRARLRRGVAGAALAAGLATSTSVDAQQLPAFGRAVAAADDATTLTLNPANLALLPGAELRWSSIYLEEAAAQAWQGHAFSFAAPLSVLSMGTGLRLDLIDPPTLRRSVYAPGQVARAGGRYQVLTWGLAFAPSEATAFGLSWQRSYSPVASRHGLSSWSLAWTERPFDALGLAAVARGFDVADNGRVRIGPSYDLAVVVRPTGRREVELGLEASHATDTGAWSPRAVLGVDLPFGRLRADTTWLDAGEDSSSWLASVSLAFTSSSPVGSSELEAGAVLGTALGDGREAHAERNLRAEVAFRGHRDSTGVDAPRWAARVRVESTKSGRDHVALLRRLWSLAEDEPALDAVLLELRAAPADGFATAQELRDAVFHLRRHGKRVLCHLEDAGAQELFVCAAANQIFVHPAGGVRFAGLKSQHSYYQGLLEHLGVKAEFVRIGAHKSAPEQLTRASATETARADKIVLLQEYEREVVGALAGGRRLPVEVLRRRIARGPFIAAEAKRAGLVDGAAFDDELDVRVDDLVGRETPVADDEPAARAPERFGRGRRIAIVHVDGNIVDGRSQVVPLFGTRMVGSYTIRDTLKDVREDSRYGAVVLRIDSGGGSAMASDVMWREVKLTAEALPVVVSMGGAAASGGYYVAAPATRIFANPLTITGSIGIFYGKADVAELLRRVGISVETYRTAPRADAESLYRPYTEDERRELRRKVGQFYEVFLSRVAEGRRMTKAAVDAVGQGRVWTGRQAVERGLVDELGGLRQALEHARRLAELPRDAPIDELPRPQTTLVGALLGLEGVKLEPGSIVPPALEELGRALAPFAAYRADTPLALSEVVAVR